MKINPPIIISYAIGLTMGFVVGRLTTNHIAQQTSKTTSNYTSTTKSEATTTSQTQQTSNLDQITSFTENHYNARGKLTETIAYHQQTGTSAQDMTYTTSKVNTTNLSAGKTQTSTTTTYESNWHVGFTINVMDLMNPTDFTLGHIQGIVTYRLIGNVELVSLTNYQLTTQVGVLIPL